MADSVKIRIDGDDSGFRKAMEGIGGIAKKSIKGVTAAIGAVSGALTAGAAAAYKFGSEYQTSLAKVSTIADTSKVSIEQLSDSVMDLSNRTGKSAADLNEALYSAISASVDTADAVGFVEQANKLAVGGFTDAASAVDIMSTVLNSYGLEAEQASHVSDVLIQTQNKGKTTVNELASSMGKVIPTANAFGVNLENLGASYAIMTSRGIATAESTTYLNSMLNELGKGGTKASEALKKSTGKTFTQLMNSGKTLGEVVDILKKQADKSKVSLADMFGSAEAGKAALTLASEGVTGFNEQLDGMINSAGNTEAAFQKMDSTAEASAQKIINNFKNLAIEMYQSSEGAVAEGMALFADYSKRISEAFKEGGITNVAEEIGNIFSDMIKEASKAAPKIISIASEVIKSFARGIKNNSSSIAQKGVEIVSALVKGISSCTAELASAAAQLMSSFLKAIIAELPRILGSLDGVTKAVIACVAAWKTFSAVKAIITVIGKAAAIFKTASASVAAYTAAVAANTVAQTGNATVSTLLATTLKPLELVWGVLTGQINLATAAQVAWKAITDLSTGGITLLISAIGAGIAALAVWFAKTNDVTEAEREYQEQCAETKDAVEELAEKEQERRDALSERTSGELSSIDNTKRLADELMNLADENGKVADADKARAQFILETAAWVEWIAA